MLRGHDDQFEALHCALKVRERKHVRPRRRVPHRTQPMFGVTTLRQRWSLGNYGELDCLVVIGDTLAIERRGGRPPAQAASMDEKGKTCRMEQQCHWENFKKICVYVEVCR